MTILLILFCLLISWWKLIWTSADFLMELVLNFTPVYWGCIGLELQEIKKKKNDSCNLNWEKWLMTVLACITIFWLSFCGIHLEEVQMHCVHSACSLHWRLPKAIVIQMFSLSPVLSWITDSSFCLFALSAFVSAFLSTRCSTGVWVFCLLSHMKQCVWSVPWDAIGSCTLR